MRHYFILPSLIILYWTLKGLNDFFTLPNTNDQKLKKSHAHFYKKLLINQVLPIVLIIPAIFYFDLQEELGLNLSMPFLSYFLTPFLGGLFLTLSTIFAITLQILLTKRAPQLIQDDLKRYEHNVKNSLGLFSKSQSTIISIFNGIGEELLMRVLVIGVLSSLYNISIIACVVLSLTLNAIHHSYQGRVFGTVGAIFAHSPYVFLYIYYNDFFFIALIHIFNDLIGLLLLPKFLSQKSS